MQLVEAQQKVDECRGAEGEAGGDVQATAGDRGEVQTRESVSIGLSHPMLPIYLPHIMVVEVSLEACGGRI